MIEIKLLKPHTDAGIDYKEGAIIEVDAVTARWLVTMQIGVEVKAGKTKDTN